MKEQNCPDYWKGLKLVRVAIKTVAKGKKISKKQKKAIEKWRREKYGM